MSNHGLIQDVVSARRNAARFYVCNLHMHSPDSHDYGHASDLPGASLDYTDDERTLPPAAWTSHIADLGIEVLGITDHNVCSWACEAARQSHNGLVVLPGCEISVKHSVPLNDAVIHLLALFDPLTTSDTINDVFRFSRCRVSEAQRKQEGYVLVTDLADLVKTIHQLGGICIGAHVGSDRGLRATTQAVSYDLFLLRDMQQALEAVGDPSDKQAQDLVGVKAALATAENAAQNRYLGFLIDTGVEAVQIVKPKEVKHYSVQHTIEVGGSTPIACILATDGHRLGDAHIPGHITHIKMAAPSVAGLRNAFLAPATRIRFGATSGPTPYPRIQGLAMTGSKSFFARAAGGERIALGFSDNLTCLIGGRGSGKSCVVEALRFALQKPEHAERFGDDQRKHQKYLEHLFTGTSLSVLYDTHERETLLVKRTFASSPGDPVVEEADGSRRRVTVGSLRVDIYGQSELEAIATDKATQRLLIDALVPNADELHQAVDSARDELRANSRQCVTQAREIERRNRELTGLADVKHQLELLQDPSISPLVAKQDVAARVGAFKTAGDDVSATILKHVNEIAQEIATQQANQAALSVDPLMADEGELYTGVLPPLHRVGDALTALVGTLQAVRKGIANLQELLAQLGDAATQATDAIMQNMKAAVAEDDSTDLQGLIGRRQEVAERYAKLQPSEVARDTAVARLKALLEDRSTTLALKVAQATDGPYEARQDAILRIRNRLAELPGATLGISLDVARQGDTAPFRAALGESSGGDTLLAGGDIPTHKFQRKWAHHIAAHCSSSEFTAALIRADAAGLSAIPREDGVPLLEHERQIICATHNPNIVVSGDAEQVIVCESIDGVSGRIARQASVDDVDAHGETGIVTHIKEIMEGGEQAFVYRARKYGIRLPKTGRPEARQTAAVALDGERPGK